MNLLPIAQVLGYPVSALLGAATPALLRRRAQAAETNNASAQAVKASVDIMVIALAEAKTQLTAQQDHLDKQDRIMALMVRELKSLRGYVHDLCGLLAEHGIPVPAAPDLEPEPVEGKAR